MYVRILSEFVQYVSVCEGLDAVQEILPSFSISKLNSELEHDKGLNPQRLKKNKKILMRYVFYIEHNFLYNE